jgi:hypothetical protein
MAQLLTGLLGAHCLQILHRPEGMRPGDLKKQKLTFDGYHMTVSGISVYSILPNNFAQMRSLSVWAVC